MRWRVLLLGAGKPVARGTARSLRLRPSRFYTIGYNENIHTLQFAECDAIIQPHRNTDEELLSIIKKQKVHLVHAQTDAEVARISRLRSEIREAGSQVFLPRREVIKTCQDKWLTYEALKSCGVPAPDTELPGYYEKFKDKQLHLRPRIGGGGYDSHQGSWRVLEHHLPAFEGWSAYTLAERLPGPTVTYQALFHDGKLVCSQQRRRLAWTNGDRGSALISETCSDLDTDLVAQSAIRAVDIYPHGIYGVDMTLDEDDKPRVTEINIGRFFTTIEFFAQAGLNMPELFVLLGVRDTVESYPGANPLQDGMLWVRSMDTEPILIPASIREPAAVSA